MTLYRVVGRDFEEVQAQKGSVAVEGYICVYGWALGGHSAGVVVIGREG